MKFISILLLSMVPSNKIIKNINYPSCRNCIHYKPNSYYSDFTSILSKCEKFGEKNIITDEIKYNFADSCRDNESKCGKEGKYFEEEKNINTKILLHKITSNMSYILTISFLILYINFILAYANK